MSSNNIQTMSDLIEMSVDDLAYALEMVDDYICVRLHHILQSRLHGVDVDGLTKVIDEDNNI